MSIISQDINLKSVILNDDQRKKLKNSDEYKSNTDNCCSDYNFMRWYFFNSTPGISVYYEDDKNVYCRCLDCCSNCLEIKTSKCYLCSNSICTLCCCSLIFVEK